MFELRSIARGSTLNRLLRLPVVRRALAAVLIPMLLLGGFGGTTLVAHTHDEHDTHLHAHLLEGEVRLSDRQHQLAHGAEATDCVHRDFDELDHRPCDSCSIPIEEPEFPTTGEGTEGLVISIPDHEQLVVRGVVVPATLKAAQFVQAVWAAVWKQPDVSEETGSPGGRERGSPLHLCGISACERLVRTSQALLI